MSNSSQALAMSKQLCKIADTLNGCIYLLNTLADEGTEAQHALRLLSGELDAAYMEIDAVAHMIAEDGEASA